jgi:MoaA/NifB/PqqE/SkfB family radical SAM enzyme
MKELTLEITNNCSLNCIQCSTQAGPNRDIFFDLDKIDKITDKYFDFNIIRLSGGEPFDHPKIDKICKLIKQKGKIVQILSCGVYYNEPLPLNFLKEIKNDVDEIIFSYHGYLDTHEKIVTSKKDYLNYPPYWDMLCDSIDHVTMAQIPYSFETVLMKENFPKLEEIATNMSAFGIGKMFNGFGEENINWHILKFVKQGRGKLNQNQALNKNQIQTLPNLIKKFKQIYPNINITYSNSFEGKKCDCGSEKAVYTCYDEQIPCSALKNCNYRGKFSCKRIK